MSAERSVTSPELVYADDVAPGHEFDLGTWHYTESEIIEFASSWDPLAIHVDPSAAARSAFGGVIASGIHSMAVMQRLSVDGLYHRTSIIAGRSIISCDLHAPARPGMTVRGIVRILDVQRRQGRGDAIVRTESSLVVADGGVTGDAIYVMVGDSLWAYR
ncbi:MAG: dehydratase [Hyphomicrobiales bacterium]|nr:MAG: dehydratase [Hyphomicrobiales bacterium]